ncbi:MAG: hybrid sensor histidine kinase/response regulator, partial [Chryseobacterium sp.]
QGVGIYNPISNQFKALFFLAFSDHMRHELKSQINKIQALNNGEMIVATNGSGLIVRSVNQEIGAQIPLKKNNEPDAVSYNVVDISVAKDNTVYLLVEGVGLCVYDQKLKRIYVKENISGTTNCMEIVDNHHLLIGTGKGMMRINTISKKMEMLSGNTAPPLNAELITTMHLDKQQQLWLGTNADGLKIKPDINDNKFLRPLSSAIQNQLILTIYEDEAGRKWIGTSKEGVIILDAKSAKFKTISSNPLVKTSLVSNFVSAFYEDPSGKLWIGTDAGGISIWNRNQNTFKNLKFDPQNPYSLSSNAISAIKKDRLGDVWVATYGGGINKANGEKTGFKRYRCINKFTGFENENVWQLLEGNDGTFWATTFSHGTLYFLNRQKDQFEVFDKNFRENLLAIKEDLNHDLWGGNASSLIKINRKEKRYEYFDIGKPVRVIFEDRFGNFWLGSEGGGLILFDRKKRKIIKRFSTLDGLSNNSVISILETNGVLWLSTFSGLSKFDIKRQTFLNYYQDDGLQSNQFLDNASLKLKSGELVLGGIKGFSIFHPDSNKATTVAAPIVITSIRINNMAISPDHATVTGLNDGLIEKIEIPYNEALAIDFAALEYSAPGKINYAYFMEGWDRGWNAAGKMRTATYTKLGDGNYRLRIRSTNTDGIWVTTEKILFITILPPWYRSWWAYSLYFLLALLTGYLFIRYQRHQSFLRYQVELANVRVNQERELNENKLTFFTNISHEFRTPLTLIINPIKEFLNSKNSHVDPKELIIV